MALEDPVSVYSARDTQEAHFVRNLLADAGIEAKVVGDTLQTLVGEVPFQINTPQVWVHRNDLEQARPIVEEYEQHLIERVEGQSEPGASRADDEPPTEPFCYHCGQPVQAGQSPCPACGQALDWSAGQEAQ